MVYEAYKNGVDQEDIKPLITKLNEAIRLLEEAIQCMPDENETKSEYYLNAATSLIHQERSRVETVLALSIRRSFQITILTWILLPLLSLLSTLVVVKLYGVYVARQHRTFLRMSIKKKQREKSKSK